MNKPLKMLLAVGVLAFTAAGLYYALLAPAKPKSGMAAKPVRPEPKPSEPLIVPGAKVGGELPGSVQAGGAPSPALSAPSVTTSATSAPANGVPGFTPAPEPMKPLPSSLPGFEPVPAGTQSAAANTAPTASPTAAPSQSAGTPATPAPAATPVAAKPALPPLPAPGTGAAPATPAPTATSAKAPAPPTSSPSIPSRPSRAETYTVKEGDSIASIWRDLTGSERGYEKLLAANPGVDASRLKIGQVLKVPESAPTGVPTSAPTAKPTASAGTYTVQSGDTLSSIAAKTLGDSKRWKEIHDLNREAIGSDPGALKVGQTLKIPGKAASAPASDPKPSAVKSAPVDTKPAPISAPASGVTPPPAAPSSPSPR